MIITLTPEERDQAVHAGRLRYRSNADRPDGYGLVTDDGLSLDIDGTCSERAVAKHLGMPWVAVVNDFRTLPGDVGRLQVRSTRRLRGRLILHPRDPDEALYVLVVIEDPWQYRLVGYIPGVDGKLKRWWEEPVPGRPAFFVPQDVLLPIEGLRLATTPAGQSSGR